MNKTYSGLFMVLFLGFILGLSGCQQEGTGEKTGQKIDAAAESTGQKLKETGEAISDKAEEAGDYMEDAAITAKIKAKIMSDPLLNMFKIKVTTTDGVVKLSGTLDSQEGIDRALEIARSLEDVKSVDNALVR